MRHREDDGGSEASADADPLSWGDLYGLIITGAGWTAAEVDATPWPDVLDLLGYWKHHPPVHVLARSFFAGGSGKGSARGSLSQGIDNATPEQLAAAIAGL